MSTQCKHIVDRTKTQCKNRTRQGTICHVHRHMHRDEAPVVITPPVIPLVVLKTRQDTCPICLDDKEIRIFQCNHGVCSDCATQLRNCICVLCRKDNRPDFTKEERLEMKRLNRHDRDIRIEEERRDIVQDEQDQGRVFIRLTDEDIRHVVNAVMRAT